MREESRFAFPSSPSSVVRKISTEPLSEQARCKASNSSKLNTSSCLPPCYFINANGNSLVRFSQPRYDLETLVQIPVSFYLIHQSITGNPIPTPRTKVRNDPSDNFGFLSNSSLCLIIKKTAQTTSIKINSQGMPMGLHACRPTPLVIL